MKKEQSPNPHFEYKFILLDSLDIQLNQKEANRLGKEGWELMCVGPQIGGTDMIMYFKRQVTQEDSSIITGPEIEPSSIRKDFTVKFGQEKTERILSFFDSFFDGLKVTTHPDQPDSIFFYKEENGKKIGRMEQDSKNGTLWCRWSGLWSFFENEISLNYSDIQYVVKTMVEHHLKREVGTIIATYMPDRPNGWRNILNEEVGTPIKVYPNPNSGWNTILNER